MVLAICTISPWHLHYLAKRVTTKQSNKNETIDEQPIPQNKNQKKCGKEREI